MRHGFFSATAARFTATRIWRAEDGSLVEVSFVSDTMTPDHGWDDLVYVGEVVEFVRQGASYACYDGCGYDDE